MRAPWRLLVPLLVLAACRSTPEAVFPEVGGAADGELRAELERRTAARSLYAELAIAYDGPERSGAFDAVFQWQAPTSIRMTAFKDVVLETRHLFDLVLTPDRYRLEYEGALGEAALDSGPAAEFAAKHPRFSAFHSIREGFGLPGRTAGPARIVRSEGSLRLEGRLSSGAPVVWTLDPATLRVDAGEVDAGPGRRLRLAYSEYRTVGGVFVPGRVRMEDPFGPETIDARLVEAEIDPPLDAWVFEASP